MDRRHFLKYGTAVSTGLALGTAPLPDLLPDPNTPTLYTSRILVKFNYDTYRTLKISQSGTDSSKNLTHHIPYMYHCHSLVVHA